MRKKKSPVVPTEKYFLHCYSKREAFLEIDIKNWEIYRVDQQTDTMTEADVLRHWPLFEVSGRDELKQFIDQNIFKKVWLGDLEEGTTVVDEEVQEIAQLRPGCEEATMCQSSTPKTSYEIYNSHTTVSEIGDERIVSPPRKVVIVPPPNTWRQLAYFDPSFNVPEESYGKVGLLCQKPANGLNDAPLA
eukprot:s1176_g7.t1